MTDDTTQDATAQSYQMSSDIISDLQQAISQPAPVAVPSGAEQITTIRDRYLAFHAEKKKNMQPAQPAAPQPTAMPQPDVQAQIDQIKASL